MPNVSHNLSQEYLRQGAHTFAPKNHNEALHSAVFEVFSFHSFLKDLKSL